MAVTALLMICPSIDVRAESLGGYSKMVDSYLETHSWYKEEDLSLLSEVMYHENGSNSDLCLLYTGSVVLNRVSSRSWPNTVKEVLYQRGQYATVPLFFTKKIPDRITKLAKELLIFGSRLPEAYVYQAMHPQGRHKDKAIKVDTEFFCTE